MRHVERGTLERWLTAPRVAGLPAPASRPVPTLSFEFFPPKTPELERALWHAIRKLEPLSPAFVSVTYGAGGSTQQRTHATVARIVSETSLRPAAHLTCVGASRGAVDEVAARYWEAGVRHIVALRGDAPGGGPRTFVAHPDGYRNAAELVAGLRRVADFEISVAAYPEIHPDAPSLDADLDNLKRKLDAGATRAITQLFFDNDLFLRFLDRCLAAGITAPIVPGILPLAHLERSRPFIEKNGSTIPDWLTGVFRGLDEDEEMRRLVGAVVAADQVRMLQANGIDEFHFYTMNRPDLTYAVAHLLGARPARTDARP